MTSAAVEVVLAGRADRLVHLHQIPARPARHGTWPTWSDPQMVAAYAAHGVHHPWTHQVEAAHAAWEGKHVVLATTTGSGKSLAAWLPAVSAIRAPVSTGRISQLRRRPTALYLSPTKALAADQLHALSGLLTDGGIADVRAVTCDGDTPLLERDWARDYADIVLTNPDFLHFAMLGAHRRWDRLLRGLRFIVVDECHAYRGVFGAHVSLVLRRLLRIASRYGAEPQVIMTSATTGDPAATAERMLGVEAGRIHAVVDDGAPSGRRTIALWQPALAQLPWSEEQEKDDDEGPRRSALAEVSELLADLVGAGHRTLAFVRSRLATEVVAQHTQEQLHLVGAHVGPGAVAAYRGGYLPEERRDLEQRLRTGDLLALATTNALELGVDIAGLDAVLIAGWPGTRVSMWQQVGRAGRAGAEGLAVLVASNNPLDNYLVHHPEAIFEADVEVTTFDPTNPYVLGPHLCAAAAEAPLTPEDLPRFSLNDTAVLDALTARGLLRRRAGGWYWNYDRPERPADLTDLRGGGSAQVQVVEADTGRVLGTVDETRADASVHTGAIYIHQGRTFRVEAFADDVALVVEADVPYRTRARTDKEVRVVSTRTSRTWGPVTWGFGDLEVAFRVTGYDRRRLPGMEIVGSYPLEMPERTLATTGCWWSVPEDVLTEAGVGPGEVPGALHAAEHAAIGLLGLIATCDRWDIGGLSAALHADTFAPTVFVYDGLPGGAGFAQRGFEAARTWISATRDTIAHCPCATGCPSCVQSPKCGNNNSPLDKAGALRVLGLLCEVAPAP
ncbi:DEAD/DEAH box helicase [Pseudactinotalea sp. Z1748]|uniref:DEAD/DEAH box helicase n=1 Tax=Pseudactinotalea sp. Z1748 TaxID=3413027 RepID=UPI003C79F815